jgi:hypothetical protein
MNYTTLQANVADAMGRSDVPSYVYTLTTAAINRDLRLIDMESTTTLTTATHPVDLSALSPAFHSVISLYAEVGGSPRILRPVTEFGSHNFISTGAPQYYTLRDGALWLDPVPDGTYTLYMTYNSALAALSAGADTNDVMSRYPDLYIYSALTHAAIWASDSEREASYGGAYVAAKKMAEKDDLRRRIGTSLETRSRRL